MTLGEIRRRPTLPGRFQPSTISVLRLNFCVRDGNRWIPQAIVTGNMRLSRWRAPLRFPFGPLRFASLSSHPQNRTGRSSLRRLTKTASVAPLTFSLTFLWRLSFGSLRCFPPSQASFISTLHSPNSTLFSRSSPRPISIIKLHTLPHFHR